MAAVSSVNLVIQKGTYFEETFFLGAEDGSTTAADSTVRISMTSDKTVELPSGRCQYDVLLTSPGGEITKVLEGNVIVEETVSL
jgi:hypothetical protein